MTDIVDDANERMEKWLEAQISEHIYQLNQVGNEPEEPLCRNCKEPLPQGQHYSDQSCRDDFSERLAAEKRNGKYRGG